MNALNFSLFLRIQNFHILFSRIFLIHFPIFENDLGLGFNSYEYLDSMFGIKSTTTQTTSNFFFSFLQLKLNKHNGIKSPRTLRTL